jgi:hypothetical protein
MNGSNASIPLRSQVNVHIGAKPNALLDLGQHVRKQAGTTRDIWYTGVESIGQTGPTDGLNLCEKREKVVKGA